MSFDYSTLFHQIGSLIARINSYDTLAATTLPADLATLINSFSTTAWLPEEGIASTYQSLQDTVTGWRQTLAGFADSRLIDPATVLIPLGLDPSAGLDQVLPQLVRQMRIDAQTVKACTSSWTQPVAVVGNGNAGNGGAAISGILDGVNSPVLGAPPNVLYTGLQTQLTVPSETHVLEVVADSMQDGLPAGSEVWSWTGGAAYGDLDYHDEGSGEGPGVQTANGSGLVSNWDFETWGNGVPAGWSLVSGSISQETRSVDVWTGSSSVLVSGAVTLAQPIAAGLLQSKRLYFVSVAIKAAATVNGGQLSVQLGGAAEQDYSGGFSLAGSAFPTGWTIYGGWFLAPAPLPSDLQLVISASGLGSTSLWIDSVAFAPAVYHGGVALGIAAGGQPWARGDRLTFTTANDGAGAFQSFFRRHYLTQLPSVASGVIQGTALTLPLLLLTNSVAETILDNWVA